MYAGKLLTLLLMIASSTLVSSAPYFQAQTVGNFRGVVVDKTGAPIARAHVWIHEQSAKASFAAKVDQAGAFVISLPDGDYDVMFSAPGFAPFCRTVWVESDKKIKLEVHLGPNIENSQID